MMKIVICSLLLFSGAAIAAAGDKTISIGYIQVKSDGLKKVADNSEYTSRYLTYANEKTFDAPSKVSSDGYAGPKGMFIRYRYEFTDTLGIIGSLSYAQQDGSTKGEINNSATKQSYRNKFRVTGDYFSSLVGPAWRLNEYVSFYGMAGVSFKHFRDERMARLYSDNTIVSDVSSNDSSTKTSMAYSLGAQFNVYQHLVIDAAYEGSSGGGDWKTNAFTVGLGYQF
ncbi:TPA: Ail/Lom family outer membrane beta-barrel protein [Enterobacter asburiae]|nr:Ail/Lom family outer membrane beta-barrel protein [Enterobacter asburiae]HEC5300563.1 Ail/Lom family outer membrane beta-barrel protein [Enterobacter asburiae]